MHRTCFSMMDIFTSAVKHFMCCLYIALCDLNIYQEMRCVKRKLKIFTNFLNFA